MQKTHQSIAKRIKITKTGKLMKVKSGKGHFNSRESGNVTRQKRRDIAVSDVHTKNIKSYLPHNH